MRELAFGRVGTSARQEVVVVAARNISARAYAEDEGLTKEE